MSEWSIDFARDLNNATLPYIDKKISMTMKESTYDQLNLMMEKAEAITGKYIETQISLRDEGNAQHYDNPWEADTKNVENITEKPRTDWCFAKTNCSINKIEVSMNSGPEAIYSMVSNKVENMAREMADEVQPQLLLSPTSSTDKSNISGVAAWFPLGTDDSTGAWNAYSGIYNDGSGTTFNAGGISSASGVANNERWASYYHDHNGSLGENLIQAIDKAYIKLKFRPPMGALKSGEIMKWSGYKFFTNLAVILNIRNYLRKADDNLMSLDSKDGFSLLNGIPMIYVPEADTARTTLYGTDPFWGVNLDKLKTYVLKGWKFKRSPWEKDKDNHNTVTMYLDLVYNIHCRDRRMGGFLISQQ